MSMNGGGEPDGLDQAAQYVAEALGKVSAHEEELKGQLQLAHEERKRLQTALRALSPEHPLAGSAPGRKAKSAKPYSGKPSRVNPQTMDDLWAWLRARGDEPFTVQEAFAGIDSASDDPVRRGIYALRDAEAIRAAGKRKNSMGQSVQTFRLLDVEAGERHLAENTASFPPQGRRLKQNG